MNEDVGREDKGLPFLQLQGDLDSFEDHFVEVTAGFDPRAVASAVWMLANEQWSAGCKFGESGEMEGWTEPEETFPECNSLEEAGIRIAQPPPL